MVPPFPDVNAEPVMDDSDIDAFIARVTVPPPPKDSPPEANHLPPPHPATAQLTGGGQGKLKQYGKTKKSYIGHDDLNNLDDEVFFPPPPEMVLASSVPKTPSWEKLLTMQGSDINQTLEEEYAKLVIPPPPVGDSTTVLLGDITIVPPVDVKTPSPSSDHEAVPMISEALLKGGDKEPLPTEDSVKNDVIRCMQIKAEIEKEMKTVDMNDPIHAFERLSIKERIATLESPKLQRAAKPPPHPVVSRHNSNDSNGTPPPPHSPSSQQTHIEVNPRRPFLWRPTEVRSADSSPVHRGKDFPPSPSPLSTRTESTGTLNRNKRVPPPPPPRRSSMPATELTNESPSPPGHNGFIDSSNKDNSPRTFFEEIRAKAHAIENRKKNTLRISASHVHSNSETAINELGGSDNGGLSPGPVQHFSSSTSATPITESCPTDHFRVNSKYYKTPASHTSSLDNAELEKVRRYRVPETKRNPRSASAIDLRRGSYEPPQKDYYTKASSGKSKRAQKDEDEEAFDLDGSFSKFKGKRSPSFTRKLLAFEFKKEKKEKQDRMWANSSDASSDAGESDTTGSTGSPKSVGRSNTFATGGSPRLSGSPRSSPVVHRHASLSKMADRALSPLRNLFGGGDRDRTSSTESDAGSAPSSPHVMSRSSNLPRSTMHPFGSAAMAQVR